MHCYQYEEFIWQNGQSKKREDKRERVTQKCAADANIDGKKQRREATRTRMASKGRKKNATDLGRSLVRKHERRRTDGVSSRHTTEANPVSVTENTSVDEFLANAEAAQRTFEAERGNARIVRHQEQEDLEEEEWDTEEEEEVKGGGDEDEDDDTTTGFFSIPKKPHWNRTQSPEDFQQSEQDSFLRWKRKLNRIQLRHKDLPPFEKNIEFWRQLWKIVEISDVVVQVVDARDPTFFHSADLDRYVMETSETEGRKKTNLMLINKADYLTKKQREAWADFFKESDLKSLFFSATAEEEEIGTEGSTEFSFNDPGILSPSQVLETLQSVLATSPLTVGFLGYPNVGKSSTINRFLTNKRLQVSATPGKTKHYQTHVLGKGAVTLVDGPGLVIPDLGKTKADMVLAGILPIDNLTSFGPSIDLLLTKVPFTHITRRYGIMDNVVADARRADRKSESLQLLSSLATMRGFMKPGGVPDHFRAARLLLKDFVSGKLLFCKAPPGSDQAEFCPFEAGPPLEEIDLELEESFPELRMTSGVHVRGGAKKNNMEMKKHGNRKKREKARRMFKDPYGCM